MVVEPSRSISDYQQFIIGQGTLDALGERLQAKMKAIPLPSLAGKAVLDVGCDNGFWCWRAKELGAETVLGIDRNRIVKGWGKVDFVFENRRIVRENRWLSGCSFGEMDVGRQYHDLGCFDVVFCFSMYHHIYQNTGGDHKPIWHWLRRQMAEGGEMLWENPVSADDQVVKMNVDHEYHKGYTREEILKAASEYFAYEYVGPALHEPHREVYRFIAKPPLGAVMNGWIAHGSGGASRAFEYAGQRRCREINHILGWWPHAGSLNVILQSTFPWEENYYQARVLDVVSREEGLTGEWQSRWCRFYPLSVMGKTLDGRDRSDIRVAAMRFEGEEYATNMVELVASGNLGFANHPIYKNEVYEGKKDPPIALRLTK